MGGEVIRMPIWRRLVIEAILVSFLGIGIAMVASPGSLDAVAFRAFGALVIAFFGWAVWRWAICGTVRVDAEEVLVLGQFRTHRLTSAGIREVAIEPYTLGYDRVRPVLVLSDGRKVLLTEFTSPAGRFKRTPSESLAGRTQSQILAALGR